MAYVQVTLRELREKFRIEVDRNNNVFCPFCNERKRKLLHFDDEKDMWRCSKCGAKGGVLHFFSKYQLGYDLPSDQEGRQKVKEEMYKHLDYDSNSTARPRYKPLPQKPTKKAASDTQLHAVYTAMASLAVFHLLPDHKKELKRRGLTSAQIERNGYRSFPFRTQIPEHIVALYNSVDPALRTGHTEKKAAQVQLGLLVAKMLEEKGHNLDGIPGFYLFGEYWCLYYNPGILIPTRNIHGQIVRWQVRTNYEPKYRTLSCRDMPGAVNDQISRCHFPLGNDKLAPAHKVIFTEGPLKADVAKALSADPCVFAAIPGIGNKKDLLDNCGEFKKAGITEIYNAFDMDRLTNPNVRSGSALLSQEISDLGLKVIPMYWGEQYAATQLMIYQSIAKNRHIPIPSHSYKLPVFEKLNIVAAALNQAGINPGKQTEESQYWDSETKGIDDYLFSLIERKEHTQSARKSHMRTYHATLLNINK